MFIKLENEIFLCLYGNTKLCYFSKLVVVGIWERNVTSGLAILMHKNRDGSSVSLLIGTLSSKREREK